MHSPTTTYAGIDWATRGHAVCVIDDTGAVLERYEVEHSGAGLATLVRELRIRHVSGVAIERPDGPVVDALLGAGLRVVVIASRHVKARRTRYASPATRTTAATPTSSPTCCAPMATVCDRWCPTLRPR